MNLSKTPLTMLSCGGMEITWRYAWAFFLTLSIMERPAPLPECVAIFFTGYIVTRATRSKPWRVYQTVLLHWACFTLFWLFAAHRFFYPGAPLLHMGWLADWLHRLRELPHFMIQLIFLACLLSFWLGARSMATREHDYQSVCLDFDKGLGTLFLLLLVKFIAEKKAGLYLEDPVTRYLVFAYFAFGLIAIGLSRPQSKARRTFRPGYHAVGTVLGFLAMLLISGVVLTTTLLPYLTDMADSAQRVLKHTAEPMVPVLVKIIHFVFSAGRSGRYRRDDGFQTSGGSEAQFVPESEMGWMHGVGWVMTVAFALVALAGCGYAVHRFIRWLFSRKGTNVSDPPRVSLISGFLSIMAAIFANLWNGLRALGKKPDSAGAVYKELLRWGRRSGVPASLDETPLEYGKKLGLCLPAFRAEIDVIVETYCQEVYGDMKTPKRRLSHILSARRKMRSPRSWLSRLKGWSVRQPL